MKIIADFHIHSHFSLATSKNLVPEQLDCWARIKGINVVGTGDCAHPGWLRELREKLEPAGNGLYRLKAEYRIRDQIHGNAPTGTMEGPFFIPTGEISSIYKKNGRVRKVHNLCVFPDFDAAERLQARLGRIGNIESDGRPILGLDSRNLLEMVLETAETSFLMPAHVWTPWFSILGSKSGFDRVEECYEDLTPHVFALETGLSSDPPMNRACGFLDPFRLVSNSDAHSPEKLGREANLFDTDLTYPALYKALREGEGFAGTLEFFPQQGKYHYDGHRKCGVRWDPMRTLEHGGICTECGRPVTRGVLYRVAELADRSPGDAKPCPFRSITPLPELIAEVQGRKSAAARSVKREYLRLISGLGPEMPLLLSVPLEEIRACGGEFLATAVSRLRAGEVAIEEGFDGEFGKVRAFGPDEARSRVSGSLFSSEPAARGHKKYTGAMEFDIRAFQRLYRESAERTGPARAPVPGETGDQKAGIEHFEGPCAVVAGPGSGKTRVLTRRILHLVKQKNIDPRAILALTFSNKAAEAMRERIGKQAAFEVRIATFHAFGLSVLMRHLDKAGLKNPVRIVDDEERDEVLAGIAGDRRRDARKLLREIVSFKQSGRFEEGPPRVKAYNRELRKRNALDLDDLISLPVRLFRRCPEILREYHARYPWVLVDEFQDINPAQYGLIRLIAGTESPNLFIVGDPDQAIYGFRGADARLMERFRMDYPGARRLALKRSFRCPVSFLRIAGQALGRGDFLEGNPEPRVAHIERCGTEKSEADWIAARIERMLGGVRSFSMDSGISDGDSREGAGSFSDFAVLCRTTAMFGPLVKAFADHGIAYQVTGTKPFYEREPWKVVIRRLRRLFFDGPSGLSAPVEDRASRMLAGKEGLAGILGLLGEGLEIREEERQRMTALAGGFGNDCEAFLLALATRQGADDYREDVEAVSLMTLHASKGLEFNVVFIPGCEEGILPFEIFGKKTQGELEEEARLFYVGITRSKKYLFLTHADKRVLRGRPFRHRRSSLLDRMEKELLHQGQRRSRKPPRTDDRQISLFPEGA